MGRHKLTEDERQQSILENRQRSKRYREKQKLLKYNNDDIESIQSNQIVDINKDINKELKLEILFFKKQIIELQIKFFNYMN
jgi:hypothetical protein